MAAFSLGRFSAPKIKYFRIIKINKAIWRCLRRLILWFFATSVSSFDPLFLSFSTFLILPNADKGAPYVTVKIPDDKLKEFRKTKTKLYKDTTNSSPKFNEQFIFALPNKAHPVTLKIANEKLGSNEELGEALLNCTAAPDLASTNGQIHVLVIYTPGPVSDKFTKRPLARLPLFRFGLERQHYFAGEKMRGLVFLNVGKPYELRGVRLFFEGIQHVYWTEQHSNGRNTYTVTYMKTVTLFSSMTTVFGIPQLDKKKDYVRVEGALTSLAELLVDSGQYAFPFEFTFPVNIPPTMSIDRSWTRYRIRGKIDRPKGKSKWIEAPINIYIEYGSLKETSDISQKVKKYGKQPIIVTAHSSKEILYLGEKAAFIVNIKNESEKKVTNLKVTLMKHYTLVARTKTRSWKVHHLRTVIKDEAIFPIREASERQMTINIDIPEGLQPSLPSDISPIIHINYVVKIAADISGAFSGKVRAYIGVKIGWRHPPQLANIPLPLAPMGNPCEIRLMPQFMPPPMAFQLPQEIQNELTPAELQFTQMNIQQMMVGAQGQPMAMNYLPARPEGYEEGENQAEEEWSAWRQSQRVNLPQGYTPVGPVYNPPQAQGGGQMMGAPMNSIPGMAPQQQGFQQPMMQQPMSSSTGMPAPQGFQQQQQPISSSTGMPPQQGFQQPSSAGPANAPQGGYVPQGGYMPPASYPPPGSNLQSNSNPQMMPGSPSIGQGQPQTQQYLQGQPQGQPQRQPSNPQGQPGNPMFQSQPMQGQLQMQPTNSMYPTQQQGQPSNPMFQGQPQGQPSNPMFQSQPQSQPSNPMFQSQPMQGYGSMPPQQQPMQGMAPMQHPPDPYTSSGGQQATSPNMNRPARPSAPPSGQQ